jgi:GAF domain-containing protein
MADHITSMTEADDITRELDPLGSVAEAAHDLFAADLCLIAAINPITRQLSSPLIELAGRSGLPIGNEDKEKLFAIGESALGHEDVNSDIFAAELEGENIPAGLKETQKLYIIPLRASTKKPLALLWLGFNTLRSLSAAEKERLRSFQDRFSPFLQNIWQIRRFEQIVHMGQEINKDLTTVQELFQMVFDRMARVLDVSYFFMLAVYHQQNEMTDYYMAQKGKVSVLLNNPLAGATKRVVTQKVPLVIPAFENRAVAAVDLVEGESTDEHPESLIFVPLMFGNLALGVLSVQHLTAHAYDESDLRIIIVLANHVGLALSNIRLFRHLQSLNSTGQYLAQQSEATNLPLLIVERTREVTGADVVVLLPYYQAGSRFEYPPTVSGQFLQPGHVTTGTMRPDDLAALTLKRQEPIYALDSGRLFDLLKGAPGNRFGQFQQRERIASTAAVPLRVGNEPIGVLFVNFRQPQQFDATQRLLIESLANYASIAIRNSRQLGELSKRRLEELEVLRQMDLEISASLNLKDVLYAILKHATRRVGGEEAAILLFNPHNQQLETEVSVGREQYQRRTLSVNGPGIVPWVFNNKVPATVGNVKTDAGWRDVYYQVRQETISELDVPLIFGEEVIGVISLESTKESAFGEADETFLVTLAAQAVLAIKKAQVYERAEAGKSSLEILHEVAKEIIGQRGNPERIIRLILSRARHLIGAEIGFFQQYENGQPSQFYVDSNDKDLERLLLDNINLGEMGKEIESGIVGHVAKTRLPYTTIGQDALEAPIRIGSTVIHSEVAVPLLTEEQELIGILDLESPRPFAFDNDDERILDLFGGIAVVAIKNAKDYARADQESERFHLLWEAGQDLAGITSLEQLDRAYDIVVSKVGEFSDAEVVIRRYDSTTEELVLARMASQRPTPPLGSISKSEGINGQVARELRTICIDNLNNLPPGISQPIGIDPESRTLVVTPLIFENSYYGNLVLSHEEESRFQEADIKLIEGLGQQLAITIHRLEGLKSQMDAEVRANEAKLMSSLGQSAYEITHRLANELGLVRSYANNIRKMLEDQDIESAYITDYLDKIVRDVSNVLNMSKGLKKSAASLGGEGILAGRRETIPVQALLESAQLSLTALPANIDIVWDNTATLQLIGVVPQQIVDILYTLVINAAEAMPEGGRISVRSFNFHSGVRIEVSDTGPGVPRQQQPKLFNLFFSTKQSSGYGLWSARQYARANGGDLIYEERPDTGATFVLRLPGEGGAHE